MKPANLKLALAGLLLSYPYQVLAELPAPILSASTDGVELTLTWSSVPEADGYRVYFAPSPYSGPETVESIDIGNVTAVSGNLWTGAAFYFAVKAYDDSGEGEFSNIPLIELTEEQVISDLSDAISLTPNDVEAYQLKYGELISAHYSDLPTSINTELSWLTNLYMPQDMFSTQIRNFEVQDFNPQWGIGAGVHLQVSDNSELVFYSNWASRKPIQGAAYVTEYINGEAVSFDALQCGCADHSHVLRNIDGTHTVVFMGRDEGHQEIDGRSWSTLTYYHVPTRQWIETAERIASHNSHVFDYDNDGDDDVISQGGNQAFNNAHAYILENINGIDFRMIPLGIPTIDRNQPIVGGLSIAAIGHQEDGTFDIVIGDAVETNFKYYPQLITNTKNYIVSYSADLTEIVGIQELPTAYFDRIEYEDVNQVLPDWDITNGKSHDIAIKVIDIDYDGDRDIIISTMLWSDEHPFGVLQMLINHDGEYVDETDERLFNFYTAGSSYHQVDYIDVNGDGFVDILTSDHGAAGDLDWVGYDASILTGSKVLVNDGTGHFVVIVHDQINDQGKPLESHVPSLDSKGKLKWTALDILNSSNTIGVVTRSLSKPISTGPYGIDPAKYGAPEFNEFYYLLHYEDVSEAVGLGSYSSGLHHYLAIGKSEGRSINARN